MKALYDSGWHHPFAAYVAALILLALVARRLNFLPGFLVVFCTEIVADATVTGAWSPVPVDSAWFATLSIVFVILGDLRYFILAEHYTRPRAPLRQVLSAAMPIAFAVPVLTGFGSRVIPALGDPRVLYLVYELLLFLLVLSLQFGVYGKRAAANPNQRVFVRRLSLFLLVQYGGWALADCVILSGAEAGHALRMVPNILYYALFLPFVYALAPEGELPSRAQGRDAARAAEPLSPGSELP